MAEYYRQRASAGLIISEPRKFLPRQKGMLVHLASIVRTNCRMEKNYRWRSC